MTGPPDVGWMVGEPLTAEQFAWVKAARASSDALDATWLALCKLLPEGSATREAANNSRLAGESPILYVVGYIEALKRMAEA